MSPCFFFNQRLGKEQKDKELKQKALESHEVRKEADRMFSEREKLKAQRVTEDRRELKAFNVAQMVTVKILAPIIFFRPVMFDLFGLEKMLMLQPCTARQRKAHGGNGRHGTSRILKRRRRSWTPTRTSASGATLRSSFKRPQRRNSTCTRWRRRRRRGVRWASPEAELQFT